MHGKCGHLGYGFDNEMMVKKNQILMEVQDLPPNKQFAGLAELIKQFVHPMPQHTGFENNFNGITFQTSF